MKDPFTDKLIVRSVQRKLLERDIQDACVAYARKRGFWARKFSSPANRSVPDYLFSKVFDDGRIFTWAEEFKAPDKTSTTAQTDEQDEMETAGWTVIRDTGTNGQADIDAFKRRINAILR